MKIAKQKAKVIKKKKEAKKSEIKVKKAIANHVNKTGELKKAEDTAHA